MMKSIALCLGLLSAGCPAMVGTGGAIYVPKDAATTCAGHCNEIGLPLGSVVIMANSVGCVCNAAPPAAASGATAGGMAALMMQEQERRRQQSQQAPQSTTPVYTPPPMHH
jgi:hypothetical protein